MIPMPIDRRVPVLLLFLFLMVWGTIFGCKQGAYSFTAFSYPPKSEPHENNWEYLGKVLIVSQSDGPLTDRSAKNVRITVENKDKKTYLSDEVSFVCGNIGPSIHWDQFSEIEIILSEVGNEFAKDEYNRQIIERGPRRLANLKYVYDPALNEFRRKPEY
jgi:hypothetical protein